MSSGPAGVSEKPFEPKNYINLDLHKKLWCTYKGECKVDDLINRHGFKVCLLCEYRKLLDIPEMIEKNLKGEVNE